MVQFVSNFWDNSVSSFAVSWVGAVNVTAVPFEANDMVYKDWAFFPFDYKENTYNSLDSYVSQVIEKVAEKNNFTVQEFDLPW